MMKLPMSRTGTPLRLLGSSWSEVGGRRDRVVATRRPGWQRSETPDGEPGPPDAAVHGDRLERVGRAGRVVAADLAVQRADQRTGRPRSSPINRYFTAQASSDSVETTIAGPRPSSPYDAATRRRQGADHEQHRLREGVDALPDQVAQSSLHAVAGDGRPDGLRDHEADRGDRGRRRRRARWTTSSGPPAATTTPDRPSRTPRRQVRRWPRGSTPNRLLTPAQAARRLRPLRRREDEDARPARVRIRSRKPCVL